MTEQELTNLENRVQAMLAWKNARVSDRLKYPLDYTSKNILYKDLLVSGRVFSNPGLLTDLTSAGAEIIINGQKRIVLVQEQVFPFTVNTATDFCISTNGSHNLKNDDPLALVSTSLLPSPFNTITIYYVVNPTGTTFQLATSVGGIPLDITDTGLGTHYFATPV